ncbi:hypothetical protein H6P81_006224 [Aristolochia fimbriata]|uniref:Carbonic anhydrase n=1 Tax=Aristolochia fimbriata TaxID=158543 RepID=A0AAV7EWQ1_ARIFI|nr:hypothetical protein H6P81_006224 [Aristolochia fimbriata]
MVDNLPNSVEWTMAEMLNQPDKRICRMTIEELDQVVEKERLARGETPNISYWDNPAKFKPECHTATNVAGVVELAKPDLRLISFATGHRGCMGTQLGTANTNNLGPEPCPGSLRD